MAKTRKEKPSIDLICELIIAGKTYREISELTQMTLSNLHDYCNQLEHSARVNSALLISSHSYADKAEEVLRQSEGTKEELMRARELAQHYRWKASKRYPTKYGDRIEVENKNGAVISVKFTGKKNVDKRKD